MFQKLDLTKIAPGSSNDFEVEHWLGQMSRADLLDLHKRVLGVEPKRRLNRPAILAAISEKTKWFMIVRRGPQPYALERAIGEAMHWKALAINCYHEELDWTRLASVQIMDLASPSWGLVNVGARMICVICDDQGQPIAR